MRQLVVSISLVSHSLPTNQSVSPLAGFFLQYLWFWLPSWIVCSKIVALIFLKFSTISEKILRCHLACFLCYPSHKFPSKYKYSEIYIFRFLSFSDYAKQWKVRNIPHKPCIEHILSLIWSIHVLPGGGITKNLPGRVSSIYQFTMMLWPVLKSL